MQRQLVGSRIKMNNRGNGITRAQHDEACIRAEVHGPDHTVSVIAVNVAVNLRPRAVMQIRGVQH